MKNSIAKPRYGCYLQGALETILELQGAIPILHSVPGCGISSRLAHSSSKVNTATLAGDEIPNTNVFEKQVIFGGGSRLREQIKNVTKVFLADYYFVLNSCESAMVGDDIIGMTNEIIEQGEMAIHCENIAGFKGNSFHGYEQVFEAVIRQLPELSRANSDKKISGLVNVFGIVPGEDPFFRGNLDVLTELLEQCGLQVNRFFGVSDSLSQCERIPKAEYTLVFSKWGYEIAKLLKGKYGTEYLYYPSIPVGPDDVQDLVETLRDKLSIDWERADRVLRRGAQKFYYYLNGVRQTIIAENGLRDIALVGTEGTVLAVGKFLKNYLGANILLVIVTDHFPKEETDCPEVDFSELTSGVYETDDAVEIQELIEKNKPEILLASAMEQISAQKMGIPLIEIANPIKKHVILSKSYAGLPGAISLMEDYVACL